MLFSRQRSSLSLLATVRPVRLVRIVLVPRRSTIRHKLVRRVLVEIVSYLARVRLLLCGGGFCGWRITVS